MNAARRHAVGFLTVLVVGISMAGCAGRRDRPSPPATPYLSPIVEVVLLAHEVTPEESLRVRLLGSVGPTTAYRLHDVVVDRQAREVYLVPRVVQGEGAPPLAGPARLDHTVTVAPLETGRWMVHVLTTDADRMESVEVRRRIRRLPPLTRIEVADPYEQSADAVHLHLRGESLDGWVERIDIRVVDGGRPGPWRVAEPWRRIGATLICSASLPRNGQKRVLEARAVDGQGSVDPSPATFSVE